jgi:antitoxin MazE
MGYIGRIRRWGNSWGLRIPRSLINQLGIGEGANVQITLENSSLVITPIRKEYTLTELLENITPNNIHPGIDTGSPVGNEEF